MSAFWSQNVFAQQLTVAPAHLVCDYEVSEKLDNQVKSKLQRALTEYGISSEIGMSNFAIVPQVIINDESTTSTTPAYCNIDFDLVLSLKDIYTGKVFSSYTISGKGIGTNKSASIAKGVSSLKLNTPDFSAFCEVSKSKIVNYYASNMQSIIARANSVAASRDYDQAIYMLSEIPQEVDGYSTKVAPLIQKYYITGIDLEGEYVLNEAKAAWAQSPDEEGAEKVAEILANMPPNCASSKGAETLLSQVRARITALNDRQFAFEQKQAADEQAERMATIKAARDVAVAWANNQPKQITKVYLW